MTLEELENELSRPTEADIAFMRRLKDDVLILGAGGKMGPSLAQMVRNAATAAGASVRVIAVSRFSSEHARRLLSDSGVETISCDLLDRDALRALPDAANVLFLVGRKFGSTANQPLTWATNVLAPALVAERYRSSRIVALSSGNVYPLSQGASTEQTPTAPVGEYAQSVLGRERIFEYFSALNSTPVALLRLNYAIDLRYGVLLDIGERVWQRRPVSLAVKAVNVIWQRDANSFCLRALELASSPAYVLNITGAETIGVRSIAERFGEIFGIEPVFEGMETDTALLSDASLSHRLLGPPEVGTEQMIAKTAEWIRSSQPTLNKPTYFEVRDGRF